METIASLDHTTRAQLFEDSAAELGTIQEPGLIEKDFWVCWILSRLFRTGSGFPTLIFKGGTSLSKGYRSIERFSEDVDLAFDRHELGFVGDKDPASQKSRKQSRKLVDELKEVASGMVREEVQNRLREDLSSQLGPEGDLWKIELDPVDPDRQTILFRYPNTRVSLPSGGYNSPAIKLEFGARSDHFPAEEKKIGPYVRDAFPDAFPGALCNVRVLAQERTFWEKVTILHAKAYGGAEKLRVRDSRHYYDVYQLSRMDTQRSLVGASAIRDAVVKHKDLFFPTGWARYDLAKPGTLRVVPQEEEAFTRLRTDYRNMRPMFFRDPPDFPIVVDALRDLESEMNRSASVTDSKE